MSTKKLKLYRISQDSNTGYDTYDSAVVAAPDPTTAAQIHPDGDSTRWSHYAWCSGPEYVEVELIGTAAAPLPIYLRILQRRLVTTCH